ncbi:FAD-binding oxidoreductase [Amycolatopsis sp. FDAARGOS 1241]|uniref:FAD-binding oxidoreductase n=1 Tax=Amycolatopsis sp. FDAARGOS 1241 TaxID=2778070 RepID=UPI00194E386C|nr:FAD-binding oxidoreductase [Amycolatopsis sp. FDAARGOS 1241]QRP49307.1 2Fe-2S iron-sulfur cluster binding domain-containing protein [Amycolatopsis sp. FDAARGOS 1241]
MGDKHNIRFEPVGIDIEADEDETILDAAFRQGVMLMHGCKEGQCSACKSFLLEGDLQMDRYSTFALADYESEEGFVLLCRGHAYSDLEIELTNYDEDMIRSGLPVVTAGTTVESITDLTHDISLVRLKLDDDAGIRFHPGQYVDIKIPGTEEHRSFSMANTSVADGVLEFIIKRYPGGKFSGLLEGSLSAGDPLEVTGPYGTFTLRVSSDRRLVFVGGGAGMSPILSLLQQMADSGNEREVVYYYGARTERDLFHLEEMAELARQLPKFRFVPCLSDSAPEGWPGDGEGETGLVTQVLERREDNLADCDVYLCGPPPMIDAALPLLESMGVPGDQVFYDKFTITAAAQD